MSGYLGELALQCSECGCIALTIEDAEQHETSESTPDDPHGGWDTVRVARLTDDLYLKLKEKP